MQSVEYKVLSLNPQGFEDIANITNLNPALFWESSSDSATIILEFSKCVLIEISISTGTPANFVLSFFDENDREYTALEDTIKTKLKPTSFKISPKQPTSKCTLHITALNEPTLRIYSFIIKSSRDASMPIKKTPSILVNSSLFYRSPNGNSAKKTPEPKSQSGLKQTTLFGTKMFNETNENKNLTRMMESSEFVDEQKKIFDNIKNNKQRTLRSYTSKQKTPTNSYKDLFSSKNEYVVCCKENEELKPLIEEICSILGLCYLNELEEGATHLIYEGHEHGILSSAKDLGVSVVSKDWLFDCISKREPLQPASYKRDLSN